MKPITRPLGRGSLIRPFEIILKVARRRDIINEVSVYHMKYAVELASEYTYPIVKTERVYI